MRDGWFLFRRNKLAVCREFHHSLMDAQFTLRTNESQLSGELVNPKASRFFKLSLMTRFQGSQSSTIIFKQHKSKPMPPRHFPLFLFSTALLKSMIQNLYWNPEVSVWKRFHFSWLLWEVSSSSNSSPLRFLTNKKINQRWIYHYDAGPGTNISVSQGTFEDDFPFPQVGYVSSLEGTLETQ